MTGPIASLGLLAALLVAACAPVGPVRTTTVSGRATAGPTCPVVPASPEPGECDARPVAGAVLVITDASGREVARVTTDAGGTWTADLGVGTYTVTPQPVDGLLGTAPPVDVTITTTGAPGDVPIVYDTGIR
jgi:hypothetical protein